MKAILLLTVALALSACDRDYRIDSPSMSPTLNVGDIINIDFHAYDKTPPQRWDIVAFESPIDTTGTEIWTWRIAGMPGEIINLTDSGMTLNGKSVSPPANLHYSPPIGSKIAFPYHVEDSSYFLLGDNTADAMDSRYVGAINRTKIRGRVTGHSVTEPLRKAVGTGEKE